MITTQTLNLKFYATIAEVLCHNSFVYKRVENSFKDKKVRPTYFRIIWYKTIIRTGLPFHIFVFIMCTFMCVFVLFNMLVGVVGDIYSKKMASSEL